MRKYSILSATVSALLLAVISTPAHASVPADGAYDCITGAPSSSTPNFAIASGAVSNGSSCFGAVVIPPGVTSIRSDAFLSATALTSITIPASVTSIGDNAFRSTALTSITIPSSVTSIGRAAFYDATSLSSVTFGGTSALTSIGWYVFTGTTALTSITIPASVTSIGRAAFEDATALTSITIPANVTTIEDYAFNRTTSLASVYFLGNAPAVGIYAFTNSAASAKAYIKTRATGFADYGDVWNDLTVASWNVAPSTPNSPTTPSPSVRVESAPSSLETSESAAPTDMPSESAAPTDMPSESAAPTNKPSESAATESQSATDLQEYDVLLLWLLVIVILVGLSFVVLRTQRRKR